jgi:hypothetical protein
MERVQRKVYTMQVTIDQEREGMWLYEEMHINGKRYVKDCIPGEDMISCTKVAEFMQMAWEAGKKGEEFYTLIRDENWNKD